MPLAAGDAVQDLVQGDPGALTRTSETSVLIVSSRARVGPGDAGPAAARLSHSEAIKGWA